MKRIAFFGPLPPLQTGIADYNAALLPLLRQDYEIDVFLPGSSSSAHAYHHGEFLTRNQLDPYDLTLYQMGNQPKFHEYMYGYLYQHPGAVVFHDYCLHHSRADMLLKRNMHAEYREELQHVYPQQAEKIANAAVTFSAGDMLFFYYPLFELVVRASLAAAAHTREAVNKLAIGDTPVVKIPLVQVPPPIQTGNGDLFPETTIIASFGYATQAKRIGAVLESVSDVLREHAGIKYAIVGSVEDPVWLQAKLKSLSLVDSVIVTGHVDISDFFRWMLRADVIVNLRHPSAGEMSATLIQSMAAAKPVIISRLLNLQDIPEDSVMRVRPDYEKEDLTQALKLLVANPALRRQLSEKAKSFIDREHAQDKVRQGYANLIEISLQRKSEYVPPKLPHHLRSGAEILRDNLMRTSFAGMDIKILDLFSASS